MQIYPITPWGKVAVVLLPKNLEDLMQSLYFSVLSYLVVNRCIRKECRILPECYLGLKLPNIVFVKLAKKICFIQCSW